ncbi:hypothetical protein ACHAXT_008535 [Thalassiosira profunda]
MPPDNCLQPAPYLSLRLTDDNLSDPPTNLLAAALGCAGWVCVGDAMAPPTDATMPPLPAFTAGVSIAQGAGAAATTLMASAITTQDGAGAGVTTTTTERRKRPLPAGIPFSLEHYPELALGAEADHSNLVHAFREPLYPKGSTAALEIAYSHRDAAAEERRRVRLRKSATLRELKELRAEFRAKKVELLEVNEKLKEGSQKVGSWNKKVFELEMEEPNCEWNDKYRQLKQYVSEHGDLPLKTKGTDEEKALAQWLGKMRSKVRKGHSSVVKYPHRLEALEALGVKWEDNKDARFDEMFAKLLEYRREHGTFRMCSLEMIKESGDTDLLTLHNWVYSQVGAFRYQLPTKKPALVRRFLDAGFSFERWYATAGGGVVRELPPFDAICRRYVENNGEMLASDEAILKAAQAKQPKRRPYKKRKKKGEGAAVETALAAREGEESKGAPPEAAEQDATMEGVEAPAIDAAPMGTEEAAINAAMEDVADASTGNVAV